VIFERVPPRRGFFQQHASLLSGGCRSVISGCIEVMARIDLVEHRLMTRLAGMIVVATGILIAIKYFG
jgi:hypothetical protein